nr:hypothetical protein [Tanacetum cinerariifolium]
MFNAAGEELSAAKHKLMLLDNMANENIPASAPTRSDDQILPFAAWVPIGKSNFVLDLQKKQKNLIFQISVDILQNTNFFRAFTASALVPAINLQQFWDTLMFKAKTGAYRFQLDEDWFRPEANLLREALDITLELITEIIRNAPYYNAYLEMVAKHERRIAAAKEGGKKKMTPKAGKPMKPAQVKQAKPATAKQPKPIKEKSTKPTTLQKADKGQAQVGGVAIREPIAEATRPLSVVEGMGKAIATQEQAAQSLLARHTPKRKSTTDQFIFQRQTPATEEASTRPSAQPQDDTFANIVYPGKTPESRPPPNDDKMDEDQAGLDLGKGHVALAGPNPEPMHDDFVATVYLKVHESLKFLADEQVILEDPPSSSGTLSFMKNLNNTYTFGDLLFNDKSTKDELGKQNVDAEVISMVTVPIHQASTLVPPISTPIIDLSTLKPAASPLLEPFTTATTVTTTTTLPLPPPPQQQSTTYSELAARVTSLEKKFTDFEQKSQTLDNATQNLGYRVFTLEFWGLPHKINQIVNEVFKEAVHIALQASLKYRFGELPEANMRENLHQRMFESSSYKSLPEHIALYEALEASMERENRDEFLVEKDMSCKRRHDDQDPLSDSDLRKKKRHDSDALRSKQPTALQSSAWKASDTREAPSSSSKQQPKTLKPDWIIPLTDLPEAENKWADALSNSYKDPEENKLLSLASKVVRAFHENNISLQFQMEECHWLLTDQVDLVNPEGHRLVPDVSKPLPLEGPPGQVTIQPQFFFNRDLEYLISYDTIRRAALSISKLKSANYPNFRLEELVPSLWIESERDHNISASYGITHWWFKRKDFYFTRHNAPSDGSAVRSHMRILSVISIKTFKRYSYAFLRDIVIRRADYNEWDALDFLFKEDYTIISKPRAVIYKDRNNQKKMLREIEVHKFSDGTLTRVLHKLDYMVKDFRMYQYNSGMEYRIPSEDDKRISEEFMEVHIKLEMVSSCSSRDKFITACSYLTNTFKEIMKAQADVSKLSKL